MVAVGAGSRKSLLRWKERWGCSWRWSAGSRLRKVSGLGLRRIGGVGCGGDGTAEEGEKGNGGSG